MSKNSYPTPHDMLARKYFGNPAAMASFLKLALPSAMFEALDTSSLAPARESYISDALRESIADLVFTCRSTSGRKGRLYILFEHKHTPEPTCAVQLLRYMAQLWGEELASGRYASEGRVLPFIIPVIFYHGSKRWNGKPLRELFEDSPYKVCVPDFEMIVSDISAISDTALWENAEDNAMLLLLKALLSKDTIDIIAHVFLFLTIRRHSNPFNTIPIFLNYIRITNSEITKELIAQRMKEIAMQQGYDIDIDMDLEKGAAEFWFPDYISRKVAESKAEGRAEGRVEGKAEGRAEEVENAKNTLLVLMEDRFVSIPSEIRTYIGNISNSSRIHSLTRSLLKAKTIQDFALLLRERQ